MKVGDSYRLEHIKLMLKQKRTVYGSDRVYLDHLIDEYIEQIKTQKQLSKIRDEDQFEEDSDDVSSEENNENEFEEDENDEVTSKDKIIELDHIYCWKCGTNIPEISKFCHKCGANIEYPKEENTDRKEKKEKKRKETKEKKRKEKGEGMSTSKKILIALVIIFVVTIIIILLVIGAFVSVVSNISDGTVEKTELFKTIIVNESQTRGSTVVTIDKIEFYDDYTKIFLTGENLDTRFVEYMELNIREHNSYVKQGKSDFQYIVFQPFGATGDRFDGDSIPPNVIREGIMFFDTWNPNNKFEIIIDTDRGYRDNIQFKFPINPEQISTSKCGDGTVFDDATNTCLLEGTQPTSKCGAGTVFDDATNTCLLEGT